jgi:hypothetical protein
MRGNNSTPTPQIVAFVNGSTTDRPSLQVVGWLKLGSMPSGESARSPVQPATPPGADHVNALLLRETVITGKRSNDER